MPPKLTRGVPRLGDVYHGKLCASCGDITGNRTRPFSRYCARCFQRINRTRHPEGKLPRRSDLAPWRSLALTALVDWKLQDESAVQDAYGELHRILYTPEERLTKRNFAAQLRRMRDNPATPAVQLSRCLGVVGLYFHGFPDAAMKFDPVYWTALGMAWLRSTPIPEPERNWATGRRRARKEPPGITAEGFGYVIATRLEPLMRALWVRILAEHALRSTNRQQVTFTIATTPSIQAQFPTDKERRKLAREVAKQRKAEDEAKQKAAKEAAKVAQVAARLAKEAGDAARVAADAQEEADFDALLSERNNVTGTN